MSLNTYGFNGEPHGKIVEVAYNKTNGTITARDEQGTNWTAYRVKVGGAVLRANYPNQEDLLAIHTESAVVRKEDVPPGKDFTELEGTNELVLRSDVCQIWTSPIVETSTE